MDQDNNVVAIGDFYIKYITSKVHEDLGLYKSMINHLPPEFFTLNHDRDEFSDVWALGVILYQLSTGGLYPFISELEDDEFDEFDTKRNIVNINYDKLENREQTQLILDQIFVLKPHNRLTVSDIIYQLHDNIDMGRIKTAMKRPTERKVFSEADESGDDINKKLENLINEESESDIAKRRSVLSGLDARATKKNQGDNVSIPDHSVEEDYKHLDNLTKGRISGKNNKAKDFMDQLPDSYSNAENSNMDNSELDNDQSNDVSDNASSYKASKVAKKAKKNVIKAKEDDLILTNLTSLVKIVVLNKDKLIVFSESQN